MRSLARSTATTLTAVRLGLLLLIALHTFPAGAQSVLQSDFRDGFGPWEPLFSGAWEFREADGTVVLAEPGELRPPIRRPTAFLLLPEIVWENVTLTVEARTLEVDAVINRDIVLIFGYQDDTHFYYAHLSSNSDGTAHNVIMRVNGDRRSVILNETLPPARLTDNWHQLRVLHRAEGQIEVFLDDMEIPLLTADDGTFPVGAVGFGSFDDRAEFRRAEVAGTQVTPPPPHPVWDDEGWIVMAPPGFHSSVEFSSDLLEWTPIETRSNESRTEVRAPAGEFLRFEFHAPRLPSPD